MGLKPFPRNCPTMPPSSDESAEPSWAGSSKSSDEFVTVPFAAERSPSTGRMPPLGFVFGSTPVWRLTGMVRSAVYVKARTYRSRLQT